MASPHLVVRRIASNTDLLDVANQQYRGWTIRPAFIALVTQYLPASLDGWTIGPASQIPARYQLKAPCALSTPNRCDYRILDRREVPAFVLVPAFQYPSPRATPWGSPSGKLEDGQYKDFSFSSSCVFKHPSPAQHFCSCQDGSSFFSSSSFGSGSSMFCCLQCG